MIAALTRAVTAVLGDGLFALRLLPALAGAVLVVLTALIARELGGGRFAQGLAGLSVICTPEWLGNNQILNTNPFEPLFWAGCTWLAIRAIKTGDSRYWLWFGLIAGLGLMNKHSTLFFGSAMVAGLLLTPARKAFAQRNFWIGWVIAGLIFLPNVLWEIHWGWPTLEFLRNAVKYKNAIMTPAQFIGAQFLITFAAIPVWVAGLWFYFIGRGRPGPAVSSARLGLFDNRCSRLRVGRKKLLPCAGLPNALGRWCSPIRTGVRAAPLELVEAGAGGGNARAHPGRLAARDSGIACRDLHTLFGMAWRPL
jgi:4-amino-4-deoxy-L-arabinose transferase-like glycosyltransferase